MKHAFIVLWLPGMTLTVTAIAAMFITETASRRGDGKASAGYGKVPLSFEANRGQFSPDVRFIMRSGSYRIALDGSGATIRPAKQHDDRAIRMRLAGGRPRSVTGVGVLPARANYFIGNDPRRWRTNIPLYSQVRYEDVYPGVDLIFYGTSDELEYDFAVDPGVAPSVITVALDEATGLKIDASGELTAATPAGPLRFRRAVAYQQHEGGKRKVAVRYVLKGDRAFGFEVPEYDARERLIIDPVIAYSTVLGGNSETETYAIAVDAAGNAYIAGGTSERSMATSGSVQPEHAGGDDAFVMKLSPDGSRLIYATYLGGSSSDRAQALGLDASGNVYIAGLTKSPDLPTKNALQRELSGEFDAFVAKIDPTGSALLYSTYLGGEAGEVANGLAVDAAGNAYIAGLTGSRNFPTVKAFQPALAGEVNAFLAKLNPEGSAFLYSTYLGGEYTDVAQTVAIDDAGSAYIAGSTRSERFPVVKAFQNHLASDQDCFIAKFDASGSNLLYSTYLGGNGVDFASAMAVDAPGSVYLAGSTLSNDFPVIHAFQGSTTAGRSGFVAKLNPDGSGLAYSTYLGGSAFDQAQGISVDATGAAYVVGLAASRDFPRMNAFATEAPFFSAAFLARLNPAGSSLDFSTLLGEGWARGVALDSQRNVYVTAASGMPSVTVNNPMNSNLRRSGIYITKVSLDQ